MKSKKKIKNYNPGQRTSKYSCTGEEHTTNNIVINSTKMCVIFFNVFCMNEVLFLFIYSCNF